MTLPHKKNFLRDILPKSSIDRPSHGRKARLEDEPVRYHKIEEPVVKNERIKKGRSKWPIWVIAGIAILALTVAIIRVFSSAEVIIVPRVDEATYSNDFKAKKDALLDSWKSSLSYSVNLIENIGYKTVASDGEKLQEKKASGKIVIYNQYSAKDQKLIKNTRFETPNSLIYRIDQSVVVPGKKTVDGKVVPGSVEAVVFADESGPKYNVDETTFRVPGFKSDTTRYAGFYAKNVTPITGGFRGVAKYVSDSKQQTVRADIRKLLEKEILAQATSALKSGTFIPEGAYIMQFESQPVEAGDGGTVTLKEKGTITYFSFREDNWDAFLAGSAAFGDAVASNTVKILNRGDIIFSWKSRPSLESSEVSFNLKGGARFVWVTDSESLALSLAGRKKSELQKVLESRIEIVSATASIAPFWRRTFPTDSSKIKVMTQIP